MATVDVGCPSCGKVYGVDSEKLGRRVTCRCGTKFELREQQYEAVLVEESLATAPSGPLEELQVELEGSKAAVRPSKTPPAKPAGGRRTGIAVAVIIGVSIVIAGVYIGDKLASSSSDPIAAPVGNLSQKTPPVTEAKPKKNVGNTDRNEAAAAPVPSNEKAVYEPTRIPDKGELGSIRNMLAACGPMPADPRHAGNWDNMGNGDQADAIKDYNRLLGQWDKDHAWRGRTVHWTLTLVGAEKPGDNVLLSLSDGEQLTVQATLSAAASEQTPRFHAGMSLRVGGTLKEYTYKAGDGSVFATNKPQLSVVIEDAYLGDKPPAAQPVTTTAQAEK